MSEEEDKELADEGLFLSEEVLDKEEEKKCPKCDTILEVDFDSEIEYCTYCDYSKGLSKRELRE